MSTETMLEKTGAVQDPTKEMERIFFEQMVRQDPQMQAAVAMKYARENGYMVPQPAQQPQMPAPPPGMDPGMGGGMPPGMPPMDPSMMGGMPPMEPSMMGAPPPGMPLMDPAMGGMDPMAQLPPELLAMMQGG